MSELDNILEQIKIDKEILDTLPKNTERNNKQYIEKIKETQNKYEDYKSKYYNEINRRYNELKSVNYENIKAPIEELNNIESIMYLLNETNTAYEKMDLDREIHNLTYYYKKNLKRVNEAIVTCIKKFEQIGIDIELKDFNYNKYVQQYFETFLIAMQRNNIDSQAVNDKFDEIYWKCPEIISYIELNLRYIYMKNEKKIERYFEEQKDRLIKKFSSEDLKKRYKELKATVMENQKENPNTIASKFRNGELQTKDYQKSVIASNISKYVTSNNLTNDNFIEVNLNMIKLYNSIYEYKMYLKYKYIIDIVIGVYKDREKYKTSYIKMKRQIQKNEKKILILNKSWFARSSITKQTKLAMDTIKLYKQLDNEKVYSAIAVQLNNESSLYDALYLVSSYYNFMFESIKSHDDSLKEDEIVKDIEEIEEMVTWPYFTILNNIKITEEKDILLIIKDRYQLLNITISKEDLAEDNLDNLMNILKKCDTYYYICKGKINLEDIQEECNMKKLLDENK